MADRVIRNIARYDFTDQPFPVEPIAMGPRIWRYGSGVEIRTRAKKPCKALGVHPRDGRTESLAITTVPRDTVSRRRPASDRALEDTADRHPGQAVAPLARLAPVVEHRLDVQFCISHDDMSASPRFDALRRAALRARDAGASPAPRSGRRTGKPVAKVKERPMPDGNVAGQRYSPTQPDSVGMSSFGNAALVESDR